MSIYKNFRKVLLYASHFTFFVYAFHTFKILPNVSPLVDQIIPTSSAYYVWVHYFATIFLTVLITTLIAALIRRFFPRFYSLISGGR